MKTVKGSKKQPVGSEIAAQGVDIEQLERLLAFMSEHGLEEFEYTKGDLRIRLKKSGAKQSAAPALSAPVASAAPAQILPPSPRSEASASRKLTIWETVRGFVRSDRLLLLLE